jgi:hypothetical protein
MLNPRNLLMAAILVPLLYSAGGFTSANARERGYEWHQGRWVHDRHEGRLGWWWVVGPNWAYYQRPYFQQPQTVIVQSAPPPQVIMVQPQQQQAPVMMAPPQQPVMMQAPPQTPVLYYCKATGTHYPETMSCPGGWTTMTATTPPEP